MSKITNKDDIDFFDRAAIAAMNGFIAAEGTEGSTTFGTFALMAVNCAKCLLDARREFVQTDPVVPDVGVWVYWRGGECPVSADTPVEVKLRNDDFWTQTAGRIEWSNENRLSDVVAYRILTEEVQQ